MGETPSRTSPLPDITIHAQLHVKLPLSAPGLQHVVPPGVPHTLSLPVLILGDTNLCLCLKYSDQLSQFVWDSPNFRAENLTFQEALSPGQTRMLGKPLPSSPDCGSRGAETRVEPDS